MDRQIRFLETYIKNNGRNGTAGERRYDKGETYTVTEATARHYINKGVAEDAGFPPAFGTVPVPADYATVDWKSLRNLANSVSDAPIRSRASAVAAIEFALENGTARIGS